MTDICFCNIHIAGGVSYLVERGKGMQSLTVRKGRQVRKAGNHLENGGSLERGTFTK
jgi:hypothetical protein